MRPSTRGGTARRGGNINVRAPGQVVIDGVSEIATRTRATGRAGTVFIETGRLVVTNGGKVTSSTTRRGNLGDAGTVSISATELVQVSGRSADGRLQSAIFSQSPGAVGGDAGEVSITTRRLIVDGGGEVSVGAVEEPDPGNDVDGLSTGNGGDLRIVASDSTLVTGVGIDENGQSRPSALIAEAQGPGSAGNLTLSTGQLLIQDQGTVTVRSLVAGSAGDIRVNANIIRLENQGQLNAETAANSGGNIVLQATELLLLRQNSTISTSGGLGNAAGDGGNIRIMSPLVVAAPNENSDIRTDAITGNGGEVFIRTEGLLGFRFGSSSPVFSEITANSQFGVDGIVRINTPELDPSKDTAKLPESVQAAVLTQRCQAGKQGQSQFVDTRRGGQPLGPSEIGSQSIWDDLRPSPARQASALARLRALPSPPTRFEEAQGWAEDAQGNLVLLAQVPAVTPTAFTQAAVPCRTYEKSF